VLTVIALVLAVLLAAVLAVDVIGMVSLWRGSGNRWTR
jgi:hypothetical protein